MGNGQQEANCFVDSIEHVKSDVFCSVYENINGEIKSGKDGLNYETENI